MKLSILIPSTYDRLDCTRALVSKLNSQIQEGVSITTKFDNRELSIGAKRQLMIEESDSEYIVFIDSDDWVSDDYISSILTALQSNPDSVGFKIKCEGTKFTEGIVTNKFPKWATVKGVYQRTPYQKSPIKREIALAIGYKDLRFAEDADYSKRLKKSKLIKTEEFIDEYLYIYKYEYQDPKIKFGIK